MKVKLNYTQRNALIYAMRAGRQGGVDGDLIIDFGFQHPVADSSGESTQISIDGRWLHRDGTWHAKPEPPSPRWLIRRDDSSIPFFKAYENGGIRWTERPEDAEWFASPELAHQLLDTDEGLREIAAVWTHTDG